MNRLASSLLAALSFGASAAAAQSVHITMLPWREPVLLDTLQQNHDVPVPADKVYLAAQGAYADLEIPIGNSDGKIGVIGSTRFQRTHNLGGMQLSRLYDCGEGPTGPYADTYRLEIAVAVYVKPNGTGGTTLGIATIAAGRDPAGTSRPARACASTGMLEQKLSDRITVAALRLRAGER